MTYKVAAYLRLSKEEYSNEKELKELDTILSDSIINCLAVSLIRAEENRWKH